MQDHDRVVRLLRSWLVELGVQVTAMKTTSPYWKPVFYMLEESMDVWLLNAAHMKAVPGRKTDLRDSRWTAELLEHGLLRPSFVPPPAIRQLRMLTRYRVQLKGDRTREGAVGDDARRHRSPTGRPLGLSVSA